MRIAIGNYLILDKSGEPSDDTGFLCSALCTYHHKFPYRN